VWEGVKKKIFSDPPLEVKMSIYMGGWVVGGSREVADGDSGEEP
jgi:hypothetical protein